MQLKEIQNNQQKRDIENNFVKIDSQLSLSSLNMYIQ